MTRPRRRVRAGRALCQDLRDCCSDVIGYLSNQSLTAFTADALRRDAVCYKLAGAGEAANFVLRSHQVEVRSLSLSNPYNFARELRVFHHLRNRLVHEHWKVPPDEVFNIRPRVAKLHSAAQLMMNLVP